MNKHLSQEKRDTLASEFTYQGKKSGMLGGYCEADFPLYYANEEMAELLGYGSVEELAASYPLGSAWFAFDQPEACGHVDPYSLFS